MTHDLHWYAETGQLDPLRHALASGIAPDDRDEEGRTALHVAAANGRVEVVDALLDAGADPEAAETARPQHRVVHRACLAAGGTLEASATVRRLVARGARSDSVNGRGETALHLLVPWCDSELVELLLSRGGDAYARDETGRTPLHVAARRGAATETEALLFGVAGATRVRRENTARARLEDEHVLEMLLAEGNDPDPADGQGQTPLHVAANRGTAWAARILLAHGARPAARDGYEVTPLHRAATTDVAELLLDHDAPLDPADRDGNTPLHRAIASGRIEVADLLLDRGAGVLLKNAEGRTALHVAASAGRATTAERLVFEGAEVNARDADGRTPLWAAEAAGHAHVVETLKRHGGKRRPRRILGFDMK